MYRNLTSVMLYHLYFPSVVCVKPVSLATTMYGLYLDWLVYTSMYAFTTMIDVMMHFHITCLVLPLHYFNSIMFFEILSLILVAILQDV